MEEETQIIVVFCRVGEEMEIKEKKRKSRGKGEDRRQMKLCNCFHCDVRK